MKKKTIVSSLKTSSYKSVEELIECFQQRQPKERFYKPIGIEVEITNVCNIKCDGCPIMIDEADKTGDVLTDNDFIDVLKEGREEGMFAYSITGGEPFIKFDTVINLIKTNHGLDLYKLNTNASYFKTINLTRGYFGRLKNAGFGNRNRYIKSVLIISLGQQNIAGIQINNAVNATSQFYDIFDPKKVVCSINITDKNMVFAKKIFKDFKKLYEKTSGRKFDHDLFKVRFFSLSGVKTLLRLGLINGPKSPIECRIREFRKKYLSGGCFNIRIKNKIEPDKAETLIPRCILRPNGDMYACPGFNRVYLIGNVKEESIGEILARTNENEILKTVYTKNLMGLYQLALKHNPSLKNKKIEKQYSPCDICQILTKSIRKSNLDIINNNLL